jgi:hypothetical protein
VWDWSVIAEIFHPQYKHQKVNEGMKRDLTKYKVWVCKHFLCLLRCDWIFLLLILCYLSQSPPFCPAHRNCAGWLLSSSRFFYLSYQLIYCALRLFSCCVNTQIAIWFVVRFVRLTVLNCHCFVDYLVCFTCWPVSLFGWVALYHCGLTPRSVHTLI